MTVLAGEEERLLACVHCGFCLPACPTYEVLGDENDSPRGRLYLMRALAEGREGVEPAFRTHIGRCLGCRACETVCPAGVEFGALLEVARADALELAGDPVGRAGRGGAAFALWCLTGPLRRPLFGLLRLLRRGRLAQIASGLPGRVGLAARLLEATRPASGTRERPRAESTRAPPTDGAGFALLEGCVMQGLFDHVHAATRGALAAAGYREMAAPGQTCCGALHAHAGRLAAARHQARRNVAAFEGSGADWIAVNSAGCGAALREYPRWLAHESEWARRAREVAERTRDVSELLAARPACGDLAPAAREASPEASEPSPRLPADGGKLRARVAYDAPCHLLHGQEVREPPAALLAEIEGLEVELLPSSERCCGGAGVYNFLHPALSTRVLDRKLEEIRAGGYDWIATGNPGCIMQIGAGALAAGLATRVVHPVELWFAALREGVPEDKLRAGKRWS